MEKRSASDNDINMKKGNFHVTYNVSSTKKRNLGLDTTYQAQKRGFSYFRVARKGQKEIFHASAWRGKTKKEVLGVTARRGKTKKRI